MRLSKLKPVTLEGKTVRLEPLSENQVDELAEVGLDASIWNHLLYGSIDNKVKMLAFVRDILSRQKRGTDLPFAVVYKASGKAIGCTRYMAIDHWNRSLEIGGTWYGLAYQRTAVNTEAKYLLLKYAFEQLECVRVQFKTDIENIRSQQAIERIGAVREGVLRNHIIKPDGTFRSSVYYSILDNEWPVIRQKLEARLYNEAGDSHILAG